MNLVVVVVVALNDLDDDESTTKAFLAILLFNVLFNDISLHYIVLLACMCFIIH